MRSKFQILFNSWIFAHWNNIQENIFWIIRLRNPNYEDLKPKISIRKKYKTEISPEIILLAFLKESESKWDFYFVKDCTMVSEYNNLVVPSKHV